MTDQQDQLREILTTNPPGKYTIDTIELSHSNFSQIFYLTREPLGISASLVEGEDPVDFVGTNIEQQLNSVQNDLDQNFSFTLPDINNQLDDELGAIPLDSVEPILCVYRSYDSSDLTAPGYGPINLQVLNVTQKKGVFTFIAGVKQLNWSKTGIIYDYDRIPMLRGLS